jgi:alkanesulfonate monooxygenase SsuD/methylene tetrahydromethanopterin reductase-like flavin-dependent oxidoreductase (luciferase family)
MLLGVHIFPTQFSFQPDELAHAAEERGLESVWFSEHTHMPVRFLNALERTSPLPEYYWQTYDIFVAMALAVTATKNIKVGTGVSLIVERNPIFLAKETATLDFLSKGRFIFGIGAGWIEAEMADHGVAYCSDPTILDTKIAKFKG